MKAYHAHNEHQVTEEILERLAGGQNIALVSDAGMPGISDPGFMLARACRAADQAFTVLPGPTAFVNAIVGSGFPCDRFFFEGFLPHKKGRQTRWKFLSSFPHTVVLYESPYRLLKCLEEINTHLGSDRKVCVARELTKVHEEFHIGTAHELTEWFEKHPEKVKGEMVIIIAGE